MFEYGMGAQVRTNKKKALQHFTVALLGVQALIVAKTDDVIGSIALAIKYLVASNDCGIRCFRQFSEHSVCSYLAAALAIVSDDEARLTIANCMSLIFDTAALSVEDYSAHKIDHLKTLCSSKGISISGKKITKKELVARLSELGTIEQKKLLLQGISQSNSTDICKELFVRHGSFCQRKDIQRRNSIKRIGVHVCNYLRQQF